VPVDPQYNQWTKPSSVHQSTFAAAFLSDGQAAELVSRVLAVANYQLTIDNNVTYAANDEYSIVSHRYTFNKGDKISVVCTGKSVNLLETDRLNDVSDDITAPTSISIGFDGTYWFADDATQKIYNVDFRNAIVQPTDPTALTSITPTDKILLTIDYSAIDPAITHVSGVAVGNDNKLWLVDPDHARVYRYDYVANQVGLTFTTAEVLGLGTLLANVTGIAVQPDNRVWIVDQATGEFYLITNSAAVPNTAPSVVRHFNKSVFASGATEILDVAYDSSEGQVGCVDRTTMAFYRVNETTGALISSFDFADVDPAASFVSGCCIAQDSTVFLMEASLLAIYNYNDASYANENPCFIARDLLQRYGGHLYPDFDLNWNYTARQLENFKARVVINKASTIVTYLTNLLRQFNVTFFLRFGRFSLFWIDFSNFRTNGKLVAEKDIKADSFKPQKEMNQYFNTVTSTYAVNPFADTNLSSDSYVSSSGLQFAGREVLKTLDMSAIYRRTELDYIMPLLVRLAAAEPEFVNVTFGFRVIRAQIHDFLTVLFSEDQIDPRTGAPRKSGRRFDNVPAMIRKMKYDLGPMTVEMKLWSLGTTAFPGYTPPGNTVGGYQDRVVLTNLGRLGRVSPTGRITASGTNTTTLADQDGANAETRSGAAGLCWKPGYKVALVSGTTKEVVQTLTIASVSGQVVTFEENFGVSVSATVLNAAGFIVGGHYLQYANYSELTQAQRDEFASFSPPENNYPTTRSREVEEQRAGLHSFVDGGLPYVLYPDTYTGL